jgi:ERCC4-related helicase
MTPITLDDLQENLDDDVEDPEVDSAGAATAYEELKLANDKKVTWTRPELFTSKLSEALRADTQTIRGLLDRFGVWTTERDSKLQALITLLTETHPHEKVLIFTEYRDTADYVGAALKAAGIERLAVRAASYAADHLASDCFQVS